MKWLCNVVTNPKIKSKINRIGEKLEIISPLLYETIFMKSKVIIKKILSESYLRKKDYVNEIVDIKKLKSIEGNPLISIIVPNYNHMDYLRERLDSIYQQTYTNMEVILLDDCSTDNSVKILKEYKEKYPGITTLYINQVNGKNVFKQWEKGIALAKGELIWIAESDDYCSNNFLEELVPVFQNEAIMLAFAKSIFVRNGKELFTTAEHVSVEGLNWNTSFVMTAHSIVKKAFSIKNIIPNVSSVVFRKTGKVPNEIKKFWEEVRLCGDWFFYLNVIKGGIVYYTNNAVNYYRIHDNSTSLAIQKTSRFYKEYEMIAMFIAENYDVPTTVFEIQKKNLEDHYISFNHGVIKETLEELYDISKIIKQKEKRLPNVLMAGYSMSMGGGETFPIILANALKKAGISITYIDFQMSYDDVNVRKMLFESIPLIRMNSILNFPHLLEELGAEVIHSHHGRVDDVISYIIKKQNKCKHIITLHGMYEATEKEYLYSLLPKVKESCSQFIYTADKNLLPFKEASFDTSEFKKIGNGLDIIPIKPIERSSLGIKDDAFVLCLVSRGIPEKGWEEGIESIRLARQYSKRDIQLLLIGDGIMYDSLKGKCPKFVHFLGVKPNIRDYFSASDIGFLPSRFQGESYPLVIIDSLFCNKPIIASDIGEIKSQITDEKGNIAGRLFELDNWQIPIEKVARIIVELSDRGTEYQKLVKNTISVSKKFDIKKISFQYLELYKKACAKEEGN